MSKVCKYYEVRSKAALENLDNAASFARSSHRCQKYRQSSCSWSWSTQLQSLHKAVTAKPECTRIFGKMSDVYKVHKYRPVDTWTRAVIGAKYSIISWQIGTETHAHKKKNPWCTNNYVIILKAFLYKQLSRLKINIIFIGLVTSSLIFLMLD